MVLGLFEQYGALNSVPVWKSLRIGLDRLGIQHRFMDMSADIAVIWSVVWAGRMRHNQAIWNQFRNSGRSVLVMEVGMIQRGHTWKLGINGTGLHNYCYKNIDHNRSKKLMLDVKSWTNTGSNILIACQRSDSEQWAGQPQINHWIDSTVKQLKNYTDRPIVIRPHPRQRIKLSSDYFVQQALPVPGTYDSYDYDQQLKSTWAVINWNSGGGPQAVISGVPAFVGPSSLAAPVANLDLSQIENPVRPDRTGWIEQLAHTEWTLEEIESGEPVARLLGL